jgi:hypothetical protein
MVTVGATGGNSSNAAQVDVGPINRAGAQGADRAPVRDQQTLAQLLVEVGGEPSRRPDVGPSEFRAVVGIIPA